MSLQFPFESKSKKDWLEKVEADLKGKSLSELDWNILDHISMSPFAHADDIKNPPISLSISTSNEWYISEEFHVNTNEEDINQQAVAALESGATALSFIIEDPSCQFEKLLKDIHLEWIFTHIESTGDIVKKCIDFLNDSPFDKSKIDLSFSITDKTQIEIQNENFTLIKDKICTCKGTDIEDVDHELCELLLQANYYIKSAKEEDSIAQSIYFELGLTDSFYLNVCKIRALKILWNLLLDSYDLNIIPPFIKVFMVTDSLNEDGDYTQIKAASQCMAAAIAGSSLIHIPPARADDKEDFHRRISRNISHLLRLESFLDRVTDPVAGSYYFEILTDKIGQSAWSKFQQKHEDA